MVSAEMMRVRLGLRADDGSMEQKTEDILGPYDIHDFLLYHFIRYGAEPEKLRFLAQKAFAGEFEEALIDRTLRMFLTRFFRQQFKRSCMPEGVKVGSVSLSPRGDWQMPSDMVSALWKGTPHMGARSSKPQLFPVSVSSSSRETSLASSKNIS